MCVREREPEEEEGEEKIERGAGGRERWMNEEKDQSDWRVDDAAHTHTHTHTHTHVCVCVCLCVCV